jgi:putative cell wall-binding protein
MMAVKAVKKIKRRLQRQEEIRELTDPKTQRRFEREADNALIDAEEKAEERYRWALELKQLQDDDTTVAINRLTAKMAAMTNEPVFVYKGVSFNVEPERLRSVQYKTHLWIAMRLLVAAAEWNIRIANFKPPDRKCIRCGKRGK